MRRLLPLLLAVLPLGAQAPLTLANGLQVRLLENHERPLIQARLELRWTPAEEIGGEGAGAFLGAVLGSCGAGANGPAALRRALDEQGIRLDFEAAPGRYTWTLRCPTGAQEAGFAFLADAVARPRIDGPALERQRAILAREEHRRTPSEWAALRFTWELIEARPEGLPSATRVAHLSLDQVLEFQRRVVRPGRARLVVHGDLSSPQVRQLAQLHLGLWGPSAASAPPAPPSPRPAPPAVLALTAGRPEATLALPSPPGSEASLRLLQPLLDRALQCPPQDLPQGEARIVQAQGRPCLLLKARGAVGGDPLLLLAALRTWVEALAARPLDSADLAVARRLRDSQEAALPLHPGRQMTRALSDPAPPAPEDAAALAAVLKDWLAPARMRVLLLGLVTLPPEAPALKGLGALAWIDPAG